MQNDNKIQRWPEITFQGIATMDNGLSTIDKQQHHE